MTTTTTAAIDNGRVRVHDITAWKVENLHQAVQHSSGCRSLPGDDPAKTWAAMYLAAEELERAAQGLLDDIEAQREIADRYPDRGDYEYWLAHGEPVEDIAD